MADVAHGSEAETTEAHPAHPTNRQYVKVAIFLAVVTALEVGIYYVPALEGVLVPFLVSFAVVKFVLVALWFMHLRFDNRIFRRLFLVGLITAVIVFPIVLATFLFRGGPSPAAGG